MSTPIRRQAPVTPVVDLRPQPSDLAWPTEAWSRGSVVADAVHWDAAVAELTAPTLATRALLVVQGGRLVFDHYAWGQDRRMPVRSWSAAKSWAHALTGILIGDGTIALADPVTDESWLPGDPRREITVEDLLRMRTGLRFSQFGDSDDDAADELTMLFDDGVTDMAAFAASRPLSAPVGSVWAYSSGTTLMLCRVIRDAVGGARQFREFLWERLLAPIGAMTVSVDCDPSGSFVGSSFVHATPEDFARFGYLYLRDGVWDGRRLLPEGWVDHARTRSVPGPSPTDDMHDHGAHWWLWRGDLADWGTFGAHGLMGQMVIVVPEFDLVVCRFGDTPEEHTLALREGIRNLVRSVAQAAR